MNKKKIVIMSIFIVIVVGIDGLQQILNWLANNKLDIDLDVIHIHLNIPRDLRQKRILIVIAVFLLGAMLSGSARAEAFEYTEDNNYIYYASNTDDVIDVESPNIFIDVNKLNCSFV